MSDLELVQQYVRENSQPAFTALVNRHVNLVYSAAKRQVRSPQLAEEKARQLFNWDNRPDCKDKKCKATERIRL